MSLNDIPLAPSWSTRFHYYHHSNASKDLAKVFMDKVFIRPLIDSAWESTLAEAGLVVKSPNKNPTWYHILKFTPGGTQINRIVEAAGRDPYIK